MDIELSYTMMYEDIHEREQQQTAGGLIHVADHYS